jgi:hypothetical protein
MNAEPTNQMPDLDAAMLNKQILIESVPMPRALGEKARILARLTLQLAALDYERHHDGDA